MGHLRHIKEEYRALAKHIDTGMGFPEPENETAWEGWKEILEILFTPEDAALAAKIPLRPTKLEDLVKKLGTPQKELQSRLDTLCDRGVVMDLIHPKTGEVRYFLAPPLGGFLEFSMMRAHDDIPKKRFAKAVEAYLLGDDTFLKEVCTQDSLLGRTVVNESALGDEVPDVLDWESATSLIKNARAIAVSLCYCRHVAQHLDRVCKAPLDNCMSLNSGADFVIRHGFGRKISKEEGLDILHQARASGLVQIADNVKKRPVYLCNCCGCCCEQLQAINRFGLPAVKPSGFVPSLNVTLCKGCGRCARSCPIAAISVTSYRREGQQKTQLKPNIDEQRCIGCGICVDNCRRHALTLNRRESQPFIPETGMERALLLAIERGHLADLFFDGGKNFGQRFLHQALRVLETLPPVKRSLAQRELRSRFVRYFFNKK